jgi:putative membrane protein
MPLIRSASFVLAAVILTWAWLGPLPSMARHSFAAHMTLHTAVVAVVAPLLVLAIAGTRFDPVRRTPRLLAPIPISLIEMVIVWAWHVPALHQAARQEPEAFVLEQGSFLCAGVLLWLAALGGDREQRRLRAGTGVAALLVTSMHMTLLGALFALGDRPLYRHAHVSSTAAAVADQQLGGVIMLLVGGAAYLAGGLWLTAAALGPVFRNPRPIRERST